MQTIHQARTIRVTGCANCPYRNMEEVNGVINRRCAHNCFIGVEPIIDRKYIDNLINSTNGDYFPDWCPLEVEKINHIIHSSSANIL